MSLIVLFDGVCNLCNGLVRFLIPRDRGGVLRFASLQSEVGGRLLAEYGLAVDALDTFVLIEGGSATTYSTAALRITRYLRYPWPLFYGLIVLPKFLRDAIYRVIARYRYSWFGRMEACPLPTPEMEARFLS